MACVIMRNKDKKRERDISLKPKKHTNIQVNEIIT